MGGCGKVETVCWVFLWLPDLPQRRVSVKWSEIHVNDQPFWVLTNGREYTEGFVRIVPAYAKQTDFMG